MMTPDKSTDLVAESYLPRRIHTLQDEVLAMQNAWVLARAETDDLDLIVLGRRDISWIKSLALCARSGHGSARKNAKGLPLENPTDCFVWRRRNSGALLAAGLRADPGR